MDEQQKKYLLRLARTAIELELLRKKMELKDVPETLKEKKACFVTLTKNDELRGCIGHLEAIQPLYESVISNALNAGFNDTRFNPVTIKELKDIKIEISVLTKPQPIKYDSPEDLLEKLDSELGVIFRKGFYQSTFLPQVWEVIPDKKMFLEQLSMKAGLQKNAWQKNQDIQTYKVIKFKE